MKENSAACGWPSLSTLRAVWRPGLLTYVLWCAARAAYAQSEQDAQSTDARNPSSPAQHTAQVEPLAPITVSARGVGTQENAKDLPFGLVVFSGEDVTQRGLGRVEDVLRATPGVNVNSSGGANVSSIYIRGVGALYPMSMDDTSVVVNIDGSPVSARHISLGNLDIDQVEVLKGPQGTMFGGLGEAGAVNVSTRKPTREFEGHVKSEYGQNAQYLVESAVGGPLTATLSGRFAILQSGYEYPITNLQTGRPVSKPDALAWRGQLRWDVSERSSALLTAERQRLRHMGENIVLHPWRGRPAMDVTPGIYDDSRKTVERYAMQIDHQLANSRITSITSYVDAHNTSPVVYDRLVNEAMSGFPSEYWQIQASRERVVNQDVRWSSLPQADVFWVAGLNMLHSDRSYDHPDSTYGSSNAQFRDFTTKRYGVYGEATYPLRHNVKLTAGLRHTWDRKTYDATYRAMGTNTFEQRRLNDDFTTGRLAFSYAITPATTAYASLAHGYNPGGFNDYGRQVGDGMPYRASNTHSMEVGIKSAAGDQPYTFNAALFLNKVKDNHLLSYDPATLAVATVNANTRSRGMEVDASWRFANGLTASVALSYLDTDIQTALFGIGGGDVRAGNRIPDIARWSGAIALGYQRALPAFLGLSSPRLHANVYYQYMGRRAADPQNSFDLGDVSKIDVRIAIASKAAEFTVWGRNLLNKHYDLYGYRATPSATYGAPSFGRTVGIGVNVYF